MKLIVKYAIPQLTKSKTGLFIASSATYQFMSCVFSLKNQREANGFVSCVKNSALMEDTLIVFCVLAKEDPCLSHLYCSLLLG